MTKLLDLTSSCKQWIVEKAIAQDSTSLNLCSLFDRESKHINSGEPTLNCSVTSIDKAIPKNKKAKVVEKIRKKKENEVNGQAKMRVRW
jgi:hypothetical protein